jgi:hypothetical protein
MVRPRKEFEGATPVTSIPEALESPSLSNLNRATERAYIASQITPLTESIDATLKQAEDDINAIIAQAEADAAAAEKFADEAAAAAAAATAQMEEGDKLTTEAERLFTEAFNIDTTTSFTDLTTTQKAFVSKGLFDSPALTALYSSLSAIGVEGLVDVLNNIRSQYPDISSEDALLLLKYDKRFNEPYMKRFAGNKARLANGLAPLDDATYLANEAAYKKIFQAYGLNQFANTEKYASFIGGDISPDEVANRVQLVYDRVQNAPAEVSKALVQFYPELSTPDLMAYFLDPKNQLPAIQRKVQAAEIGGAALAQKLGTSLQATTFTGAQAAPYTNVTRGTIGVENILNAKLTPAEVDKAAAYVADVLPVSEKLSSIYANGYAQYGQAQAEQEAYLGKIEAKRAREALVGREKAEFSGTSGVMKSQRRATGGLI